MVDNKEIYKFDLGVKRLTPLTPKSDWDRISPHIITFKSHSKGMRIKEMIMN